MRKLHAVIVDIIEDIKVNEKASEESINITLDNLDAYKDNFNQLVSLEFEIGLKTNSGLVGRLNETNVIMDSYFLQAYIHAQKRENKMLKTLYLYFILTFVLFLVAGIRLSYFISKKITEPLRILSGSLNQFVASNFSRKSDVNFVDRNDEVGTLAMNLHILEDEIYDQINFFNQKVDEKTKEVKNQNDQIRQQNNQIEIKNEALRLQNEQIEAQKVLVEEHNQGLIDSIRYAKRIQATILPDRMVVDQLLKKHFIFYEPKDIVSGDFYWIEQALSKEPSTLIGSVDCTGHGVPGAFMSVLGYTTLNDALKEYPEGNPGDLLNYLHSKVCRIFTKNGSEGGMLYDGMDLALLRLYPDHKKLEFAGAYNSLYLVRENQHNKINCTAEEKELKIIVDKNHTLYEIRGDRFSIGHKQNDISFTCHTIELFKGDRIYVTSDGYTDQFGGPKTRRFQKKALSRVIA